MYRPALIIGLGGTGQWVLTWLKRNLILSNNGKMPNTIRLVEIDTTKPVEMRTSPTSLAPSHGENVEVEGFRLSYDEFVYIGGDSFRFVEAIKDGQLPQISRWFNAENWLKTLPRSSFIVHEGAGQVRPIGRLALFKDIIENRVSIIISTLQSALNSLRLEMTEVKSIDIYIVGAFSGGTGSGLIVDIALLIREISRQLQIPSSLIGFLALPSVFYPNQPIEAQARTFASWREINRFMMASKTFSYPEIRYDNGLMAVLPDQKLFDRCYLLEGKSEISGQSTFPMVAEIIETFLNEKSVKEFNEFFLKNLPQETAQYPNTPLFGSVNAFSFQVPDRAFMSKLFFAQKLIQTLLGLDEINITGRRGQLSSSIPVDRNLEDRGLSGKHRSNQFFTERVTTRDGNNLRPSIFMFQISRFAELYLDQANKQAVIDQVVNFGQLPKDAAHSWGQYYIDLGDINKYEYLFRDLSEFLNYNLLSVYRRREGETEEETRSRFRRIPEDVRTRFGGTFFSNGEMEEFFGRFGDVLREREKLHIIQFRELLQNILLSILNGFSESGLISKKGKIGYALDFVSGIVDILDRFIMMMEEVRKYRLQIKPEEKAIGLSNRATQYLNSTTGKKIFWLFEHPDVKSAELEYLKVQQRLLEIRREDIVMAFVVSTARQFKTICEQTKKSIEEWINYLGQGDIHSSGLWSFTQEKINQLRGIFSFRKTTPEFVELLSEWVFEINDEHLSRTLQNWLWTIDNEDENLRIYVDLKQLLGADGQMFLPDITMSSKEFIEKVNKRNQEVLMSLAGWGLAEQTNYATVAEEIKRKYPDPVQFAARLTRRTGEGFGNLYPQHARKPRSLFIAAKASFDDPYFFGPDGVIDKIRLELTGIREYSSDYFIQIVSSDNLYKLTSIATVEFCEPDSFKSWRECFEAYKSTLISEKFISPDYLHNFTAEQNAALFEKKYFDRDGKFRIFHPRVVTLLENLELLKQFLYLSMLGYVHEEKEGGINRWEISSQLGNYAPIWLTRGSGERGGDSPVSEFFTAIYTYVILGKNLGPGQDRPIDYAFLSEVIDTDLNQIGLNGEFTLLKEQIAEGGFVSWLEGEGSKRRNNDEATKAMYVDLAIIAKIILEDRILSINHEIAENRIEKFRKLWNPIETNIRENKGPWKRGRK